MTDGEEKIIFLRFNQDFSHLGVAVDDGWSYYSLDKFEKTHEAFVPNGGTRHIERMFSSNLVAVVACSSPRKLQIMNMSTGREMCYFFFSSSIIRIRLNKARLVVLLENKIYIHEIPTVRVLHEIHLSAPNSLGIMDLSSNTDRPLLVHPISDTSGIVEVFDTLKMETKCKILCHESAVACLALNETGNLLATASEKGTIIRIFSTSKGTRLFEFRRGILRNATIHSMVFSPGSNFLAISSDTETIHIFKLQPPEETEEVDNTWTGWFKASLASFPTPVTEILFEERAFATISAQHRATISKKCVLGFQNFNGQLRVLVASYDGLLRVYGLSEDRGGECRLLKQHSLAEQSSPPSMKMIPPDASVEGASAPGFSESTFIPTVSKIPDFINQAGLNYGYGLIQSMLDAGTNLFDKTGSSSGGKTSKEAQQEKTEVSNDPFKYFD